MRAVIDLGTNTFNLVVADKLSDNVEILYEEKCPVHLGKGVVSTKVISTEAIDRALKTLLYYKNLLARDYPTCKEVSLFATATLRTATNRVEFISIVKEKLDFEIQILSGEREAFFIFEGVKAAIINEKKNRPILPKMPSYSLIMDIGGGSTELIFAKQERLINAISLPIGVTFLKDKLHIGKKIEIRDSLFIEFEIENLTNNFFRDVLRELNQSGERITLIGSSGAFDTLKDCELKGETDISNSEKSFEIPLENFFKWHLFFRRHKESDILEIKGMKPFRAGLISIATVLINFIVKKIEPEKILQTDYAMKEGILFYKGKL